MKIYFKNHEDKVSFLESQLLFFGTNERKDYYFSFSFLSFFQSNKYYKISALSFDLSKKYEDFGDWITSSSHFLNEKAAYSFVDYNYYSKKLVLICIIYCQFISLSYAQLAQENNYEERNTY